MKIKSVILIAGHDRGIVAITTLLALQVDLFCVANTPDVSEVCNTLGVPWCKSVHDEIVLSRINYSDMLLSVHGREIVPNSLIRRSRTAVNVHPYLYAYKGANPVERAFRDANMYASVGAHLMTDILDVGKVLREYYINCDECITPQQVKSKLTPYYIKMIRYLIKGDPE